MVTKISITDIMVGSLFNDDVTRRRARRQAPRAGGGAHRDQARPRIPTGRGLREYSGRDVAEGARPAGLSSRPRARLSSQHTLRFFSRAR